jgi:hypothetical protein
MFGADWCIEQGDCDDIKAATHARDTFMRLWLCYVDHEGVPHDAVREVPNPPLADLSNAWCPGASR